MDIQPVQAIDFLNEDITYIEQSYRIDVNKIKEKQIEIFEFCKKYLEEL